MHNSAFHTVAQINGGNGKTLRPAWVSHTGVLDPLAELQVTPIVIDARMFVTDGHDHVFALDAATGKQIWPHKPIENDDMPPIEQMIVCCGRNNKGVAYANGKGIYVRLDNVVVALDADKGKVHWKTRLAQVSSRCGCNNAPQFGGHPVIA